MTPRGSELSPDSPRNPANSNQGGAESGAPLCGRPDAVDVDLAGVVDAWADLPAAVRAAFATMVGATKTKHPATS
jgi:hypothetical protein